MAAHRNQARDNDERNDATEKPENEKPETGRSSTVGIDATEKPVPTKKRISQYLISVEDATGTIVKMEKVDEKSGKATELTQDEYAAAYSLASYSSPYYAANAAQYYDPMSSPAMQAYSAYIKYVSDYLKAFSQPTKH